jgi:predicted nucleic acid-binding protein
VTSPTYNRRPWTQCFSGPFLRGAESAIAFARRLDEPPVCSEITRVEVMRGLRSGERRSTERLLSTLRWVPVDEAIARRAGEIGRRFRRSHHGFGTADLIIAATAQELGLDLATTNVRHFPMISGLVAPY